MKVSVVMATCQGGRFLEPQLQSIYAQDIPLHEVIISDDASTDGTVDVIQHYAQAHANLVPVLSAQRAGINGNFRRAIARATGDLILIADQDDLWEPGKARAMLAGWQGEDVLYSDGSIINARDEQVAASELAHFRLRPVQGRCPHYFLFNNCVSGHNMAISREFAASFLAAEVPAGMMYDQWMALLASLGGGVGFLEERLCRHRIHDANAHNNRELKRSKKEGKLASHHWKCNSLYALTKALLAQRKLPEDIRQLMHLLAGVTALESRCIFSFQLFLGLYRMQHLIWPHGATSIMRKIRNLSIGRRGGLLRYL